MDPEAHLPSLGSVDQSTLIKDLDREFQDWYDLPNNECKKNKRNGQALEMKRWIRQPLFIFPCALFTLCVLLLIIIIILVAASYRNQKEISGSSEKILTAIMREGSLESDIQRVLSEVEKLADTIKNKDGPDTQDNVCGPKWKHYGGSCYYVSRYFKSWSDGKKHCEDLEAHLVVISSKEEQDEVNTLTKGVSTWIGLTEVDGEWKWVDGTSYDSSPTFWDDEQPDDWYGHDLGGGEDCALIHYGDSWNDSHCSLKSQYICEKKSP